MNQQQQISKIDEKDGQMTFTLSNTHISFVNGLRRAIIANVPVVVFKTAPYEENKCVILKNTIAGLNNEYIKHRLSGIPIHITEIDKIPLQNYLLELDVENKTDSILLVTTKDFKIKNIITEKYLSETETRNIFPPDDVAGDFIHFLTLKPQLDESIPGQKISLTCEFSLETSGKDGMYSAVSTCAYCNTQDTIKSEELLTKKIQEWKDDANSKKDFLDLKTINWRLTDAKRIYIENSYDFKLQSIGVYTNREIVILASHYLAKKCEDIIGYIENGEINIEKSKGTIPNSFDIKLNHDENHTIGCIIEHLFYSLYYEQTKIVNYVGLQKLHPDDDFILLRLGYIQPQEPATVLQHLQEVSKKAIEHIGQIKANFTSSNKPYNEKENINEPALIVKPMPKKREKKVVQIPV